MIFRLSNILLLLSAAQSMIAQSDSKYLPASELGISTGIYIYQGDLTPHHIGSLKTVQPGLQISAGKYISNTIFLRAGITTAFLKGNDHLYGSEQEYRYYRNYFFKSTIAELHTMALAYIFNNKFYEQKLKPYTAAGAGIVYSHRKSNSAATDFLYFPLSDLPARLIKDAQKNNAVFLFSIFSSAGMRYDLNDVIALSIETIYRFGFTDYIDGFSIAAGNKKNDQYYSINIGTIIKFADKGLNRNRRRKLRCKF